MKKCSVPGCGLKHKAQTYCNKHYRRFQAHGDPQKTLINHNMPDWESSFNFLFYLYKKNAEKRNIKFNLLKNEFKKLTSKKCYYCNNKPIYKIGGRQYKGYYIYNGIDRKNSNFGYSKRNCVTCCKVCNFMKRELSEDEFLNKIKEIYEYHF